MEASVLPAFAGRIGRRGVGVIAVAGFEDRRFGAAALLTLALAFLLILVTDLAVAQQAGNHIRNRGNPNLFLNNANGIPTAEPIQAGAPNAQWSLEPVPGEILMRIRNG